MYLGANSRIGGNRMYTIKVYETITLNTGVKSVVAETIRNLTFEQVTTIAKLMDRLDQNYIIKP